MSLESSLPHHLFGISDDADEDSWMMEVCHFKAHWPHVDCCLGDRKYFPANIMASFLGLL